MLLYARLRPLFVDLEPLESFSAQAVPHALAALNRKRLLPRKAARSSYRTLFEASPLSQVVVSRQGQIREINGLGAQSLGRRAEDLVGTSFKTYVHAADRSRFAEYLAETLEKEDVSCCRLRLRHAAGDVFTVLAHSRRVSSEGEMLGSLTLTNLGDVPELLPETGEQAKLWAQIAEEMQMPLASMIGFASMLRKRTSAENREYATAIGACARRLLNRLGGIADLARLHAHSKETAWERVDLVGEVQQTLESFQSQAVLSDVRLGTQLPAVDVPARLDPPVLGRILSNLMSLALERAIGGEVEVSIEHTKSEARIRIRATASLERTRIWEASKTSCEPMPGAHESLDMILTKRLAEAVGGHLQVHTENDQEQVFVLHFTSDCAA